jgi:hypothetical protein
MNDIDILIEQLQSVTLTLRDAAEAYANYLEEDEATAPQSILTFVSEMEDMIKELCEDSPNNSALYPGSFNDEYEPLNLPLI